MRREDLTVVELDGLAGVLTLKAAARRLGTSYSTLRRYLVAYRIPVSKVAHGYLVCITDLRDFSKR